ncbi:hypothetical protein C6T62_09300 [Burkholderia multivorans]|nr:hypothetical protein C6T62_09300 [Burkholderia multivorans]
MPTIPVTTASLKHILEHPGDFHGWLCLPRTPWTLDTEAAFIEDAAHTADFGDGDQPFRRT